MNPKGFRRTSLQSWTASVSLAAAALVAILSVDFPARAQEKSPPASEFVKVREEFQELINDYLKKWKDASEAEREKLRRPDAKPFIARMWKLVEADPAAPGAADGLVWLSREDYNSDHEKPLKLIRKHHLKSDKIGTVCDRLSWMDDGPAVLREIIEQNPSRSVQVNALYALGDRLMSESPSESEMAFERIARDYADETLYGEKAGELAKRSLYEIRSLAIGKTAPEIEGADVDGKQFKLSDYRGKVVVIDFWGDW